MATRHHHSKEWLEHRQFGIVIDAGSSGSRIHIYSWLERDYLKQRQSSSLALLDSHDIDTDLAKQPVLEWSSSSLNSLPVIEPGVEAGKEDSMDWTKKIEPGISSFEDRPDQVNQHLLPLLTHATKVIPREQISSTPIYFMATAGLRLVPETIRVQILENVCQFIKEGDYDGDEEKDQEGTETARTKKRFEIGECKDHVQNISGQEEGVYGWLAVNYMMGGFDRDLLPPHSQTSLDDMDTTTTPTSDSSVKEEDNNQNNTLGFLDMGGASAQIAFEPTGEIAKEHDEDLMVVRLKTLDDRELEHRVFVTTFLGYGSNQARRHYVEEYLLADTPKEAPVTPVKEEEEETLSSRVQDPCLPRNLDLDDSPTTTRMTGSGSFDQCLDRVEVLLNRSAPCEESPCLFNGVHTPPIDFKRNAFIGVSEFWYSTHDLLTLTLQHEHATDKSEAGKRAEEVLYNASKFRAWSREYCGSDWEQIRAKPEWKDVPVERLALQCFKSAWVMNVLHGGFGIPEEEEKALLEDGAEQAEVQAEVGVAIRVKPLSPRPVFQSINSVKDVQVTWTLGAMLLISSGSLQMPTLPSLSDPQHHHHHSHEQDTTMDSAPTPEQQLHQSKASADSPEENVGHVDSVVMVFGLLLLVLAIAWVVRSRSSSYKFSRSVWSNLRRWIGGGGSGGSDSGFFGNKEMNLLPSHHHSTLSMGGRPTFVGRIRRIFSRSSSSSSSTLSTMEYSLLESGQGFSSSGVSSGNITPTGHHGTTNLIRPNSRVGEFYLAAKHRTRTWWWSVSDRIWPEPERAMEGDDHHQSLLPRSMSISGAAGSAGGGGGDYFVGQGHAFQDGYGYGGAYGQDHEDEEGYSQQHTMESIAIAGYDTDGHTPTSAISSSSSSSSSSPSMAFAAAFNTSSSAPPTSTTPSAFSSTSSPSLGFIPESSSTSSTSTTPLYTPSSSSFSAGAGYFQHHTSSRSLSSSSSSSTFMAGMMTASTPPRSTRNYKNNKKRFSGDCHSLFKDGRGRCVINTSTSIPSSSGGVGGNGSSVVSTTATSSSSLSS